MSDAVKAMLARVAHLVNHKILDVGKAPVAQGFEAGTYDLVVTSDLIDVTAEESLLANVRSLLKVGGQLLSLETNMLQDRLSSFPFAMFTPTEGSSHKR